MDDAVHLRVRESGEHALHDAGELCRRQAADVRSQRPARDVFHGDERHAVVLEVLQNRDDVRVVQGARETRLADEPLRHVGGGCVEARELLERNVAVQVLLAGEVDDRHAATADLPHDSVAANGAFFGHACTLA